MTDLYEVLGVAPTADAQDIRHAYLRLVREYHPDRDSRPGSAEKFLQIQAAYEELGDAAKRQRYDLRRKGGSEASAAAAPPPGPLGDILRAVQDAMRQRGAAGQQEQTRTVNIGNMRVSVKLRTP